MARTSKSDPFEKFRFRLSFLDAVETGTAADSKMAAAFHDCQMPKRTTTKGVYREGDSPDVNMLFPGLSTMEDIVLGKGLTKNTDFQNWANKVHKGADTGKAFSFDTSSNTSNFATYKGSKKETTHPLSVFRKDITISMLDRSGNTVKTWKIYNAFPVSYVTGSDLNASEDGEKSIETLTLAYEDFVEVV